jgi:hypothetical protein
MKNRSPLLLLLIVLLAPGVVHAQIQTYVSCIAGQYSMSDLKKLQQDNIDDLQKDGLKAKTELSFSSSLQIEAGTDVRVAQEVWVGGFVNYAVTRGQVGYADHTGFIRDQQNVSRVAGGFKVQTVLPSNFRFYGKIGFNYSMLSVDFASTVNDVSLQPISIKFNSAGFLLEPGASWSYNFGKAFVRVNVGYEISVTGNTSLNSDSKSYLVTSDKEKVGIDWGGVRGGLSLGWTFGRMK